MGYKMGNMKPLSAVLSSALDRAAAAAAAWRDCGRQRVEWQRSPGNMPNLIGSLRTTTSVVMPKYPGRRLVRAGLVRRVI